MNYFGSEVTITGEVKYIGEGEDPEDNIYFQAWKEAVKKFHGQPERLNPEDEKVIWSSVLDEYPYQPFICDSLTSTNK